MTYTEDVEVYPLLEKLATCLCAEIISSGLTEPCFCGLLPGAVVQEDFVDLSCGDNTAGMAWVRLVTAYPSTNFPNASLQPTPCGVDLAFQVEVGIIRPFTIDSSGNPPGPEEQLAAVQQQLAEMAAMKRAITCCYGNGTILNSYTPRGPNGILVGGTWLATASVLNADD